MKKLDYNQVMPVLKAADQGFTEAYGCGAPFQEWDTALEASVVDFNAANGTEFDPTEARLQYIERQEAGTDDISAEDIAQLERIDADIAAGVNLTDASEVFGRFEALQVKIKKQGN